MAIQTITYSDKQAMGTQPSIPEINKITDSNMNEIKSVVNNNASVLNASLTYSTTEQVVGTWIDNKPIYRKVISSTSVTTGGETSINTGISNLKEFTSIIGVMTRSTGSAFPIPRAHTSSFAYQVGMYYVPSDNTMRVEVGSSVTNVSKVTIILEYTKTTD